MRPIPALALLTAVVGCVAPPTPPERPQPRAPLPERPAPPPRPVPVARPVPPARPVLPPPGPAADWRDRPVTPGTWSYARDARGSRALFGAVGSDARVVLRCDLTARQLFLSRPGDSVAPLTVRTTSATRTLAVQPTGGTPPYVAVALAPGDPLLDAMAFSRGKLVIEQAGAPVLVVPAWAEIGRVVEDCRG